MFTRKPSYSHKVWLFLKLSKRDLDFNKFVADPYYKERIIRQNKPLEKAISTSKADFIQQHFRQCKTNTEITLLTQQS